MKRYRRLGNRPAGSADTVSDVMKRDHPIADFLAYQESRNISPYTLRNYQSTFASLAQFCAAEGLDPDLEDLTTDFFGRQSESPGEAGVLPLPLAGRQTSIKIRHPLRLGHDRS